MAETHRRSFRDWLKDEFRSRQTRNAAYSLRAFARDLDTTPATLSGLLNARRGLSQELAERLADRLGLESDEHTLFCSLARAEHARSPRDRREASQILQRLKPFADISLEQFRVVSDWEAFATLELFETLGFDGRPESVAQRLGIPLKVARETLQRLRKVALLEEVEGRLRPSTETTASPSGIPSETIRKSHRQILSKALDAVDTQDVTERDLSHVTFALHPEDLPRAVGLIRKFRRELAQVLSERRDRTEVYCLAVQLFSLERKNHS